jgi:nucleoside 2-deoxyribosyltransferase
LEAPAIALKNDIESLRDSEVIVVCLTNLPSAGVLMEIGMATALNKRMIIVVAEETEIPYLLRGLEHIRESKVVRYRNEEDLIKNLARAL